ncbi:MAG TPA: decaprenyl-phosphate phosphoribosyltransferase [candidate division Zixibacteria bacterium]|nr:decaprenyl-phosphate phosphoribosyltransferase [candidate division Zixibacteria bacterium]
MIHDILRLVRPAQWLKNGIMVLAIVFAGELAHADKIILMACAIALYCLLSSAVYTFNDVVDAERDRLHPLKKNRPLAAGRIRVATGAVLAAVLAAAGLVGAWFINGPFFLSAVTFLALNLLYSLWWKHVVILDVLTIALGFVVRAYAGAFAIDVPASTWFLINTLLLALFLGLGKRRHELLYLDKEAQAHRKTLVMYSPYLLDQLIAVVTAAMLVIYMLYTFSTEVMHKLGTDKLFVTIPFVVYGVFRYLYLIHRKDQGGSPTRVLIDDRPILLTVMLWLVTASFVLYVL